MGETGAAQVGLDVGIQRASLYLEALDRHALAGIEPPLSTAQFHALAALQAAPGQSLGALAERLLTVKSNASGIIDRLLRLDLVRREVDTVDARKVVLSLTDNGQRVWREAVLARRRSLDGALAPLSSDQRAAIERAVEQLVGVLHAAVTTRSS